MTKNPPKISLIGSRATSVLSVALVLIIVGLCATLGITFHQANNVLADGTTVLVTLNPGESDVVTSQLKRAFHDAPYIDKYEYTDATLVLSREIDQMSPENQEALQLLGQNPFGNEFNLYIADKWRNADSLQVVSNRIQAMEGVDNVVCSAVDGSTWINRILLYGGVVVIIMLIISIVLITNTISLSIYSRRFTIHTMKLVGATNSFIRRPFVRAGMVTGIVAGVLAAAIVCGTQVYLLYNDYIIGPWITPTGIALTAVGLILLGAIIARAAAWRAATAYLLKSYDLLFKN